MSIIKVDGDAAAGEYGGFDCTWVADSNCEQLTTGEAVCGEDEERERRMDE